MSFSPVPLPGSLPAALRGRPGYLPRSLEPKPAARPATLTRRYEVSWLDGEGNAQSTTRLAPAVAAFEEAVSAFTRGTLIQTTQGLIAVEDLVPGMELPVTEGGTRKLAWVGSMTVYPACVIPGVEPVTLTRVMADAFGVGRPMPDLVLGPRARLLMRDARACALSGSDAVYAPASAFRDGETAITVNPMAPLSVYHLVLDKHATIRAAGMDVEAYHPGPDAAQSMDPQMASLFLSLFPHLSRFEDFGPLAHPRLTEIQTEDVLAA